MWEGREVRGGGSKARAIYIFIRPRPGSVTYGMEGEVQERRSGRRRGKREMREKKKYIEKNRGKWKEYIR